MVADGRDRDDRLALDAGADDGHRPELIAPAFTPGADTIFALSSGSAPAAIAVVRISGALTAATLAALAGELPPPRRAVLRTLTSDDGDPLDRAILLWLPGPDTATGEDVGELQLHGGRATIAAVLAWLARRDGLRLAAPGEFTRRALNNGRIDLAQAEGLADLLSAETESQRRTALRSAEGGLGKLIAHWRARVLALAAEVEAAIEFAEEHDGLEEAGLDLRAVRALHDEMMSAIQAPPAERLRDGIRIVIGGPVNAGKSTLMNALAGREVAIATPIAGTTRDTIEAPLTLDGVPCILIDSAGLRDATDEVERIGIDRAEAAIAAADIVLWLGDPRRAPVRDRVLAIRAMCDSDDRPHDDRLAVSAVTGHGLSELRHLLAEVARDLLPREDGIALTLRQRGGLQLAADALLRASALREDVLCAEELRVVREHLGNVNGVEATETMLDAVFARFCIGK